MKKMNWMIVGLALLTAAGSMAGEISRVADLQEFADNKRSGNSHASHAPDAAWSYLLVNEYGKFHSSKTDRTDWGKALNSSQAQPLNQSGPARFEKRQIVRKKDGKAFETFRYNAEKDHLWLYWNKNSENPAPEIRGAAVVAQFTVPKAGRYSIQGELKYEQYAGAEMKQAAYEIGILRKNGAYEPLFHKPFPKAEKLREITLLANLSTVKALQELQLEAGDRLCFIAAGARANYRGLKIYDGGVKVVSDQFPDRNADARERVLRKLAPASRAELAATAEKKKSSAFDLFRQRLLNRVAQMPEIEHLYFWLHGPADADELLRGVLTTRQYGKFADSKVEIGLPGKVQWFRFPADGYDLVVRDLSTMQWSSKLAEKYKQTGDVRYLNAWIDYWADFAENWPRKFAAIRNRKEYLERLPQHSILWCDIPLYLGWRIQAFLQGLNAVSRRPEAAPKIDGGKFAEILLHIAEYEAATAERQLAAKEWLPNQRQHCAIQLFLLGNTLPEFQDAARWREIGLQNVLESGILPDGSDMEQSFNYNSDLPNKLAEMMTAVRQLPEKEREPLRKQLEELYRNRCYFLHSLARPDGALPIAGKNNTWRDYGKPRQAMPGLSLAGEFFPGSNEARNKSGLITDFSLLPLSKQIKEFVYEKRGTPPVFRSITFPFGGWSVLRSGWDSNALYAFLKSSRPGNGHWREGGNGLEIFAFGQPLVVNSGGEMYHPDPRMNEYWNATVAHNSISVDGCGQKIRLDAKVPRAWKTTTGDRFLAGREFDLVEGRYTGKYAGWNFYRDGANVTEFNHRPYREIIDDVTHHRTVILVKSAGLFVIRDTVESTRNHLFTQSWLLAPEYTPELLRIEGNCATTTRPDAVNAAFYFYGIAPLKFSTHYGVYRDKQILGWVARLTDREKWRFTPALQLFAEWNGSGRRTLYTVIVPFRGENPVLGQKSLSDGFELTLKNGRTLRLAAGKLTSGACTLTEQGESGEGRTVPLTTPKQFHWKMTEKGVIPEYE